MTRKAPPARPRAAQAVDARGHVDQRPRPTQPLPSYQWRVRVRWASELERVGGEEDEIVVAIDEVSARALACAAVAKRWRCTGRETLPAPSMRPPGWKRPAAAYSPALNEWR